MQKRSASCMREPMVGLGGSSRIACAMSASGKLRSPRPRQSLPDLYKQPSTCRLAWPVLRQQRKFSRSRENTPLRIFRQAFFSQGSIQTFGQMAMTLNFTPKSARMVHVLRMRQLVHNNVVNQFGSESHKGKIETHITSVIATAPPRALFAKRQPSNREARLV